jgi:hypothetical protein
VLVSGAGRWSGAGLSEQAGFGFGDDALSCPGISATGEMAEEGIPARVLTAYLATRKIVVEKTDSYTTLILFSMGITKGNGAPCWTL